VKPITYFLISDDYLLNYLSKNSNHKLHSCCPLIGTGLWLADCFSLQEFDYLAQLLRSSGYRQSDLETAMSDAVPATWSAVRQIELADRLAVFCKPSTPTAPPGSTKLTSRIGFLWVLKSISTHYCQCTSTITTNFGFL